MTIIVCAGRVDVPLQFKFAVVILKKKLLQVPHILPIKWSEGRNFVVRVTAVIYDACV